MTKQVMKFSVGALVLTLLGFGALYMIRSYIPEYQAQKAYEKIIEGYKNDPYGGETPEETLMLFIEALKKGDIELASKYYIWDKQEKRLQDLIKAKEEGRLPEIVAKLERYELTKKESKRAFYERIEDGVVISAIIIEWQGLNGKWKITE
jgi:hypothetical protein